MIQLLWTRHYQPGVTGSFHGDMAHALVAMLADPDCDRDCKIVIEHCIRVHAAMELAPTHTGRKYFCEQWGTKAERAVWRDQP